MAEVFIDWLIFNCMPNIQGLFYAKNHGYHVFYAFIFIFFEGLFLKILLEFEYEYFLLIKYIYLFYKELFNP